MTALSNDKGRRTAKWGYAKLTLASGTKAFKGSSLVWNGAGKVVPATAAPGRAFAGTAIEQIDATSGDKKVNVELPNPITVEYFANGGDITAADLGKRCFFVDDTTVVLAGAGKSQAGRIWDIHANGMIGVELYTFNDEENVDEAVTGLAFTANDLAVTVQNGALYDIPTTAGASTVTLAAPSRDGITATFSADGTKNGHTVQYRDATGTVPLTAALVASKRHLVTVKSLGGKWFAIAASAP